MFVNLSSWHTVITKQYIIYNWIEGESICVDFNRFDVLYILMSVYLGWYITQECNDSFWRMIFSYFWRLLLKEISSNLIEHFLSWNKYQFQDKRQGILHMSFQRVILIMERDGIYVEFYGKTL
jgi:hypothetical protein